MFSRRFNYIEMCVLLCYYDRSVKVKVNQSAAFLKSSLLIDFNIN